jgi:hypothetical protein
MARKYNTDEVRQITTPSVPSTNFNQTYFKADDVLYTQNAAGVESAIATRSYVDASIAGLSWKQAVRVATVSNVALLSGLLTIDGVTLLAGDRVLVKNQTVTTELHGIYVAAAGAWSRAADANSYAELISAAAFVSEGTANAGKAFVSNAVAGGTIDSTVISFVQFSSSTVVTPSFVQTFTAQTSVTVTAATHGKGINALAQVYETVAGVRTLIDVDVTKNASGDITMTSNAAIDGEIVIA